MKGCIATATGGTAGIFDERVLQQCIGDLCGLSTVVYCVVCQLPVGVGYGGLVAVFVVAEGSDVWRSVGQADAKGSTD